MRPLNKAWLFVFGYAIMLEKWHDSEKVSSKQNWLIDKVIGASHGYQDDGPRPTAPFFLRPTLAWGPLLGSLGFLWLIFCAGHLWLGARLLGSLDYSFVFRLGVFVFLFLFSASTSWIPRLWYENIILAGLEFRIPRSPHSEALLKNTPSGVNVCVEMIPSFKEGRGDYFCKGVLLACPPSQV